MYRLVKQALVVAAVLLACSLLLSGSSLLSAAKPAEAQNNAINGVRLTPNLSISEVPASTEATIPVELSGLEIMPIRLRNDAVHLAARFAYIPGSNPFNQWINAKVWKEIRATNIAYKPQPQPVGAGFGDRGCIQGSSTWPAADILSRPATGPTGGTGTSVVCDIRGTYGNQIEMAVRTVAGGPGSITRDELDVRIVNTITGELLDPSDRWGQQSATSLWESVIALIKRETGTPAGELAEQPTPAQLELVKRALNNAHASLSGELFANIPPGLHSPQLADHGVAATTTSTSVAIDERTVRAWTSTALQGVLNDRGTPFLGTHKSMSDVAIDCTLVPCIALTFDDGPTIFSSALLDTLKSQRVNATFFMIGINVNKMPDIVARSARDGNEIGSHTMDHRDLTKLSTADARAQVLSAADAIAKITGVAVTLFRAPYGAVNQNIINAVGLPAINWNVDPNDWLSPGQPALIARTIPVARNDSIILMHEIKNDSVQVTKTIIQGLRDRGFEPVTISQLFGGQLPLQNLREVKR